MADVVRIESPWARAVRSFLSAIAADPVLLALVATLASAGTNGLKDNLVPVVLAVISAGIVGLAALLLGYSEAWRTRTQTPLAKGIAQAFQKLAASVAVIEVASLNSATAYSLGDKFVAAAAAAILSGFITFALAKAQGSAVTSPA